VIIGVRLALLTPDVTSKKYNPVILPGATDTLKNPLTVLGNV
jgi:hypothetical protein